MRDLAHGESGSIRSPVIRGHRRQQPIRDEPGAGRLSATKTGEPCFGACFFPARCGQLKVWSSPPCTSSLPTTNPNPNAVGGVKNEGFAIEDPRPVESSQDLRRGAHPDQSGIFPGDPGDAPCAAASTEHDDADGPLVAIIDEGTARKYWPDSDPLGRRDAIRTRDATKPWTTIVGVVKDIKSDGLDIAGIPHLYVSLDQDHRKRQRVE